MQNSEDLNERREYKYLLPERLVPYVRAAAQSVCRRDPYAGPDGLYTIRSLYLDTDRLQLFWANERELGDRVKVRIRSYPQASAQTPVFLEVKRRMLDVIAKSRGSVPPQLWQTLLAQPEQLASSGIPKKAQLACERFLSFVHTWHLEPKVLVEYDREAYISEVDEYARLTFDLHIRSQRQERMELEADPDAWRPVDHPLFTRTQEPMTLLELKFAGPPPRWMFRMVQRLELQRHTFSKYGYSIQEQLGHPDQRVALTPTWEE